MEPDDDIETIDEDLSCGTCDCGVCQCDYMYDNYKDSLLERD